MQERSSDGSHGERQASSSLEIAWGEGASERSVCWSTSTLTMLQAQRSNPLVYVLQMQQFVIAEEW